MGEATVTALEGPAPETQIAADLVKRALPAVPVIVLVCAGVWGAPGAASAGYAAALVVVNLVLSAVLLSWSARVSLALLMATALAGYLVRLGLLFLAVYAVKDAAWVEPWPLGLTLIVTHLGLLLWETRYVSASLAFPALRPRPARARTKEHPSR